MWHIKHSCKNRAISIYLYMHVKHLRLSTHLILMNSITLNLPFIIQSIQFSWSGIRAFIYSSCASTMCVVMLFLFQFNWVSRKNNGAERCVWVQSDWVIRYFVYSFVVEHKNIYTNWALFEERALELSPRLFGCDESKKKGGLWSVHKMQTKALFIV